MVGTAETRRTCTNNNYVIFFRPQYDLLVEISG
jgi:hypothetical protein